MAAKTASGLVLLIAVTIVCHVTAQCGDDQCRSVKGDCYVNQEHWMEGCLKKRCIVEELSWRTEIVKIQCEDKDGTCIDDQQPMPAYGNCVCYVGKRGWSRACTRSG